MPEVLQATDASIADAVRRLRAGRVVALPTETVYGLGGDTFNPDALGRIFRIKGRPADNPLIAHVWDTDQARRITEGWDSRCDKLAERLWPGPLTLVLPKHDSVPSEATAGLPTIAVRSPAHPVARKLLASFGGPISAPSANRSGRVSPTRAEHVAQDLADVDDLLILDGGPCEVGIESTVLDLTSAVPRVLRPGAVTVEQLRAAIGEVEAPVMTAQASSPGTSAVHYAPCTPSELVDSSEIAKRLAKFAKPMAVMCFDAVAKTIKPPHRAIVMPHDAAQYASCLYEALRQADALGCAAILIERPPPGKNDLWSAVHDRLRRATTKR